MSERACEHKAVLELRKTESGKLRVQVTNGGVGVAFVLCEVVRRLINRIKCLFLGHEWLRVSIYVDAAARKVPGRMCTRCITVREKYKRRE